jgi:DNA-directed RNA polymerase beta' subunit
MKTRHITPPIVRSILRNRLKKKAHIISSETNSVDWIIRIRFNYLQSMMKTLDTNRQERDAQLCHRLVTCLLDTVAVCGNQYIKGAYVRELDERSEDEGKTYVVDTQGCALLDLIAAPFIDWYRTTSNDVTEIHETLGIEAAVNVLFNELNSTLSFDGTYVDPRHVMMVVNTMTRGGYIMPLSRHGINRMNTGPFIRCSFEETPDILCEAASFGEVDNGKGVSQNIMTGKLSTIGSGMPSIQMASNTMHPRTINLQKSNAGGKVLKSSVRRRNTIMEESIEYMEVKHDHEASSSQTHDIVPPFAAAEENSGILDTDMFSTPFAEQESEINDIYERPKSKPKMYRPSSPDDDMKES